MTTFLEAAKSYGIQLVPNADAIVAKIDGGKIFHQSLRAVGDRQIDNQIDVYVAGGGFVPGAVTQFQGRTKTNLRCVWGLPFDCDLADFLEVPKDVVYAMPQEEIEGYLPRMVEAITNALDQEGIPVTCVTYTGHGILAWTKLASVNNDQVAAIDQSLKVIVKRVNQRAGFKLIDPQGTDAGTRISRLVGSLNGKSVAFGLPPRKTRELARSNQYLTAANLVALTSEARPAPPVQLLPDHGLQLSQEESQALVNAIAPHWQLGQKHALSLAVGGMLAKASVPEAQALAIIEALSVGDNKPWDRHKSVTSSYNRVRAGADVRGYFALRDFIPSEAVEFVDGMLDTFRKKLQPRPLLRASGGKRKTDETRRADALFRCDPPPAEAFYGWIGSYHAVMEPTTEAADAFHLGAAITLIGAMIGRRVRLKYASDPLYANVYSLLIGPSGSSRKDTAIRRMLAMVQLQKNPNVFVNPAFQIHRDVSSAEGVVSMLKDTPNTMLYLTELSGMLANARRKSTTTILDRLIEAWDTPHVLQNLNKMSPQIAINPYLSIIAATQPGRFATQITDEDIHSGFANRWLYLPGVGKEPRPSPPSLDENVAWGLYLDLKETIEKYPDGTVLSIEADATERWNVWYEEMTRSTGQDEEEDAMRIRHAPLIHKIALIYAVSDGAPRVTLAHLNAAITLVDWMWSQVRQLMREWGVTRDVQLEHRIFDALDRKGPMFRRDLQRMVGGRKWSAREFATAFESMLKNGTVAFDPTSKRVGITADEEGEASEMAAA